MLILSAALGVVVLPSSPAGGGGANRAGVVVRQSDGTVRDMCVFFEQDEISGYELLERSGLTFEAEDYGTRHAICKIGNDGCSPSKGEDCLECRKPDAWSYYLRNKGDTTWVYSQVGADDRNVRDGYIDGWSWGEGSQAPKPPAIPFSDVCPATATSTTAPRPVPASGGPSGSGGGSLPTGDGSVTAGGSDNRTGTTETERLEIEDGTSPEPSDEASPSETDGERNEARESTDSDDTEPASYLMFGGFALVFALIAAALYFMRRRRAQSDT
jgi:hypothetical protein